MDRYNTTLFGGVEKSLIGNYVTYDNANDTIEHYQDKNKELRKDRTELINSTNDIIRTNIKQEKKLNGIINHLLSGIEPGEKEFWIKQLLNIPKNIKNVNIKIRDGKEIVVDYKQV